MNSRRTILIALCLFLLAQMAGGTVSASANGRVPDYAWPGSAESTPFGLMDNDVFVPIVFRNAGRVESTARWLTDDLTQQGYEVERGYFELYTQDECPYSYEVLHSCLGNNPAAPYVVPILPSWSDEWIDPGTAGMLGPTEEGYSPSYRFDPGEAIVILALLPPPARYLGLQTYLMSRPGEWDVESDQYEFVRDHVPAMFNTFFSKLPNNQARLQLFADLSDPINNVVIYNESGAIWDQVRYFVITPDQTMDTAIRESLNGFGVPDNFIFTEQIPSTLGETDMELGLEEGDDDFLTLIRYAMPDDGGGDGARSAAWREELPLVVLRIRDTRSTHDPQPYEWVDFESRAATDPPEVDLKPQLDALADAVCESWGQPSCSRWGFLNLRASPLHWTGPTCVDVGMNCLAPSEDAAYFFSSRLPLPDDRVYAAIGALSTQTENATYVGLGLNSSLTQLGFANIEDVQLAGSADEFDSSGRFFLHYFARDCTDIETLTEGSLCYSIGDQLPYCTDPEDLACATLVLTVRDYLFPGTQRGPLPANTLTPEIIQLQKPALDQAHP